MTKTLQNEEATKLVTLINGTDATYINAILNDISDGLEIISGFPRNRIYLSLPPWYGSMKQVLEPFHVRGYSQQLVKTTLIATDDGVSENSFSLSRPLQKTQEAKAFRSSKPLMAVEYAEVDMEGSVLLGEALDIKSSLLFPLISEGRVLGVVAIDSPEQTGQDVFLSFKDVLAKFLGAIARKLSEVIDYWAPVIQERRAEEVMKAYKASLILELPIQEGMADLAVLMVSSVDIMCGERIECLVPFSLASREENDRKLFDETLRDHKYTGRMILGSRSFVLTSELMEKGHDKVKFTSEASNTPSFFSLRDFACSFEIELEKKAGFTAAICYPVVDRQKNLLYAVIFYLKQKAVKMVKAMLPKVEGKSLLKSKMKALESRINAVLYGLSASSLVTDHLIKICQVNKRYEDFNKMKDIRRGLTEFLHTILYNIMVVSGADCGTIGVLGNINGKKYVIVEREGGIVVGAKAGDIHNYIRPVRVGTPGELLTKELSLSGMSAAQGKIKVAHGIEGVENDRFMPCPGMKSTIAVPIRVGQETIAMINLGSRKKYFFSEKTQKLLEMISEIVGANVHKLIMKYEVSVEVLKLYGGRYPYIKNDALNYLAELYHSYFIDLPKFLDDILKNYKSRRRDRKDKDNHITLKDIKTTYLDSSLERINLEEYLEKADNDIANYIYLMLTNRKASFFDAVQDAYSRHDISRNVALLVYEKAKLTLAKPLVTRIAVHLNVCSENYKGNYDEKKKIERFRQFYKKTIGIKI
ncbi:MAG: GAF domain-containing protein [Alphaproteobacteria bacterium]|uniref:GAF domain-containing protein n=1 Tax=Candidatus Nitrobium versatile TaxID=2884831 RepID=A0A953J3Q5_9BACT|nr:GAF domain-containing protein [Candidatus Nitrobium versatile]